MKLQEKRTKIVATIGPVTESQKMLEKLLKAGLNVIRMNFSHGDFAEHQRKIDNGRAASKKTGLPVAFLQDLGGPKIRIGTFYNDADKRITLKKGQKFTLTSRNVEGTQEIASITYKKLPKEVKKGETILIDDGKKRLEIIEVKGTDIICKVIVGGDTKGRRGVNLPNTDLSISALTPKDMKDLEFGIENDVDFFALSFVRRSADIKKLRNILEKRGSKAHIIAKVETPQAVENIDEIIELSDGIMVARGDLAIEVPAEEVPLIQKMIIQKCNQAGKPVITATQMLESMISSPVPTRAEVSDIANAIIDGTDAIMLSEETTLGEYPVESVNVMSRVARHTESEYVIEETGMDDFVLEDDVARAITSGALHVADEVGSNYIVCITEKGYIARLVSRYKPYQNIVAITPNQKISNQLQLSYGVNSVVLKMSLDLSVKIEMIRELFAKNKWAKMGDKIIIISDIPFGKKTRTSATIIETI
jgi:pyruvate kinase